MTHRQHHVPGLALLGLLGGLLALAFSGADTALGEEAKASAQKEAAQKMIREKIEAATKKKGTKKKKKDKPERIVISKPVWNQKAGFGLPVPPGWTSEIEGTNVVLKSPDDPAEQSVITLGPEPTELEAEQYIKVLQKQIADEKKTMPMPQKPRDILGKRIHMAGYLDSMAQPPGIGAVLVFDRPGDQVFVIRVFTRDEKIIEDYGVMASLGLIRFRDEPIPNLLAELGLGEKEKVLDADVVNFKKGEATLSEFRIPLLYKRFAEDKAGAKGDLHRFRTGIVAPKDYSRSRAWPVVFLDAPAEIEALNPYQKLADGLGVIVVTLQRQSDNSVWPPEMVARVIHTALGHLRRIITLDEHRVYLASFGDKAADMQAAAAILPQAGGLIAPAGKDALSKALADSPDAKERLAAVVVAMAGDKDKAKALAEAWKKAGLKGTKVVEAASPAEALQPALTWLIEQDRQQTKADLSKLMDKAAKLEKGHAGRALAIYRHILGSGLGKQDVAKADKAAKALMTKANDIVAALRDKADFPAEEVMPMWETAQSFHGTPEGVRLLLAVRPKVEAQ